MQEKRTQERVERHGKKLATALSLVFLVSCTGLGCSSKQPAQRMDTEPPRNTGSALKSAETELEFKEILVGERITQKGVRFPFHSWRASDGVIVNSSMAEFNSVIEARSAFSKRLREASREIEASSKTDDKGRRIGERAVVIFTSANSKSEFVGIIWTDGPVFHDVESSSLRHALAFERRFYPPTRAPSLSSVPKNE
jgi:hypothetical protein